MYCWHRDKTDKPSGNGPEKGTRRKREFFRIAKRIERPAVSSEAPLEDSITE